jgi:hypothetical protein
VGLPAIKEGESAQFIATVSALASTCASHNHANGAPPDQASDFISQSSEADAQKGRLDPITKL